VQEINTLNKSMSGSQVLHLLAMIRPYIVFTALNSVWRRLDKTANSIVDIGCGKGEPILFINKNKRFYTVGLDAFKPYLLFCHKKKIHDDYVLCDVKKMPLIDMSFDIALCTDVLEHLRKDDGRALMEIMEKIAVKQIIISTPVGECKRHAYEGNPFQEHLWIWNPSEIEQFGYRVNGISVRNIGGDDGLLSVSPKIIKPALLAISILMGFITYYLPILSGRMVCSKISSRKVGLYS
jgi:SAM-dependent methyltransferase